MPCKNCIHCNEPVEPWSMRSVGEKTGIPVPPESPGMEMEGFADAVFEECHLECLFLAVYQPKLEAS